MVYKPQKDPILDVVRTVRSSTASHPSFSTSGRIMGNTSSFSKTFLCETGNEKQTIENAACRNLRSGRFGSATTGSASGSRTKHEHFLQEFPDRGADNTTAWSKNSCYFQTRHPCAACTTTAEHQVAAACAGGQRGRSTLSSPSADRGSIRRAVQAAHVWVRRGYPRAPRVPRYIPSGPAAR